MTGAHPELRGDHHVHSTFSDDATSTLEEDVAAAHARGLTSLRLVDHVRSSTAWLPEFRAATAALSVPDGLVVTTGVETKVLDVAGALDLPPGDLGVDAVLVSDHQVPGPDGPWTPDRTRAALADGLPVGELLDRLVDALVAAAGAAADRAPVVQVAHCFSILPKVGLTEDDLTDAQLARWAHGLAAAGALVEVNEKWTCPGPRALRAAEAAGARLVAATDSHTAADVGVYDRVAALLTEARA